MLAGRAVRVAGGRRPAADSSMWASVSCCVLPLFLGQPSAEALHSVAQFRCSREGVRGSLPPGDDRHGAGGELSIKTALQLGRADASLCKADITVEASLKAYVAQKRRGKEGLPLKRRTQDDDRRPPIRRPLARDLKTPESAAD